MPNLKCHHREACTFLPVILTFHRRMMVKVCVLNTARQSKSSSLLLNSCFWLFPLWYKA